MKTVLIGLGRIGQLLEKDPFRKKPCTHAGVLLSKFGRMRFDLTLGVDISQDRMQNFSIETGFPSMDLGSFQNLSKKELQTYNLAIIATPSNTHEDLARFCLENRIRHILIEKPVALSKRGAAQLENLRKKQKAKIWINHERRYHPSYQWVKQALSRKQFGSIRSIRASVFTSARNPGIAFQKQGGGPLLHDGTHALDLIHWICGSCSVMTAKIDRPHKNGIETRAYALLESKERIPILLDVSGGREYFQFELDIHTDSHRMILSNDGFVFYESQTSKLYSGFQSLHPFLPSEFPNPETSNAFLGIYKEIYDVYAKKTKHQEGTLFDNIQILEMIESIYRRKK
ncbi:MAG: Gfo/Idh/MocA family oxidoreductase [Leptospira sp.]|nr:Gfo/Idh/MocA family oxidoreductase [Leptospira sp.]